MSFILRRPSARPQISWPVESLRDPQLLQTAAWANLSSPASCNSSRPSDVSSAPTSSQRSFASFDFQFRSLDHSSEFASDEALARYPGEIDITDNLPNKATLDEAGDILIYDSEGNSRSFKSLYSGDSAIGDQQLVVFVRHFYCGVSLRIHLQCFFDSC
jgi:hypothetical protein